MHIEDQLRGLRPTDATIEREWPVAERLEMRAAVRVDDRRERCVPRRFGHRPLRRFALPAAAAAAVAAAAVVVSVVLPGGTPGGPSPAAAAELRRLAVVAGQQGETVGPHQFAYANLVEEQTVQADMESVPPVGGSIRVGDVDRRPRRESWLAPSGVEYFRVGGAQCLSRAAYSGARAEDGSYEGLSGNELATLPTDTDALAHYLDDHPTGDNRGTRNRFLAAGDLVRSGLASPELRAAALRGLSQTGGLDVRTGQQDTRGRAATTVAFTEGDSLSTLYFDPATSQVIDERQNFTDQGKPAYYAGVVEEIGVVDRLPDLPSCKAD